MAPDLSKLEIVRRFERALDLALYDRELDRQEGGGVSLLVDADVAIDVIVGLTDWDPATPAPEIDDWGYIVKALISTGYVPKLQFLRPHLVELDRFIGRIPRPAYKDADLRKANLKILADQWQLSDHDKFLAERPDTADALNEFVRSEGFEVFVKLELCYGGTAYDRFLRLSGHLDISNISAYSTVQYGDELAQKLTELVASARSDDPKPINDTVDGYALAELARIAASGVPVRFYTQTGALLKLANLPEFKDVNGRTVFRGRDYFVLRCSFSALRFSNMVSRKRGPVGRNTSFKQFVRIRDILREILSKTGNSGSSLGQLELERALERPELRSLRIIELIDDFKRLEFLSEVFLRWDLPKPMALFIPYLKAKFDKPEFIEQTRLELSENHDAVAAALDETVGNLRNWTRDYFEIRTAIRSVRDEWSREPDPWRDLGLGRWGLQVNLSPDSQRRLKEWIEAVYSGSVKEHAVADFALMIAAREYRTADDLAVALCVLWSLKLYKAIIREWREAGEELRNGSPVGLQALYIVAQIKSLHKQDNQSAGSMIKEIGRVINSAKTLWEVAASSDNPLGSSIGAMCVAHVSYWAWTRAREMNWPNASKRLAEQSYQASDAAARSLAPGSLMWAFSINHSAYIRIRSGFDRDKIQELLRYLGDLNEEHEHYRFADTRAWAFTELAERVTSAHGFSCLVSDTRIAHLQQGACENITAAQRRLVEGKPWFGDIEITRHWNHLEELKLGLECALLEPESSKRKRSPLEGRLLAKEKDSGKKASQKASKKSAPKSRKRLARKGQVEKKQAPRGSAKIE